MDDSRTPIVTAPDDLILSIVALAATAAPEMATRAVTANIRLICFIFIRCSSNDVGDELKAFSTFYCKI
jgi:hypothetical protein